MSQPIVKQHGYAIEEDGGHGFYKVFDPLGVSIGTCEGLGTAREMVSGHIRKVYGWYEKTSNLSPLQAKAAALLTSAQAEKMIEAVEVS